MESQSQAPVCKHLLMESQSQAPVCSMSRSSTSSGCRLALGFGSPSINVGSHPLAHGDAWCYLAYVAVLDLFRRVSTAAELCGPADAFCAGDCVVFSTFLAVSQDEASRTLLQDLTVAYWVCMSLAALISLVSVGYKAYEWYEQVRTRIRAARNAGIDTKPTRREALLAKIAAAKKTWTSTSSRSWLQSSRTRQWAHSLSFSPCASTKSRLR
jgi:hypothetical protein